MIYTILVVAHTIRSDIACYVFLLISNKSIIFSDPYYVVDPANPFNNVMETACSCWNMVAEKAKQFLESPLFRGLSESNEWV